MKTAPRSSRATMNDPDLNRLLEMQEQLTSIPAVLYFPSDVLGQLHELCSLRQFTPHQLIDEALKSHSSRFEKFVEEIMTPLAPGEPEIWPEDPLYALACVTMLHFMRTFTMMMNHLAGFEEPKAQAPANWSFSSVEERDDPADWWKAPQ
jgi:hypothetical protein